MYLYVYIIKNEYILDVEPMYIYNEIIIKPSINVWLVGATYPSEKYEFVNWDDDSQYMGK